MVVTGSRVVGLVKVLVWSCFNRAVAAMLPINSMSWRNKKIPSSLT